ncbi:autoinducer binding domain-containing protein [Rhodalgimonas zhirmunskyi]|uniref:LuxR family transcriptional regulator n=1 Tax=Rhodalgimonas zhirmunskyi TaxID=2964767 RepID=A0AAJ1UD15_9RHOB|nr:autoinducer binding domain-containing protein [Rhodoalgimonas zhirmunskyi]MDQ2095268.1 LuxR family transcriptional regulator [Rhodoalgimonas zhirmunskyi]
MDLIDLSNVEESDGRFLRFLNELCDTLEFDFASYATTNPVNGAVQGFANYPDSWIEYYSAKHLHHIDPTIRRGSRSIAPVDWTCFEHDDAFDAVFRAAPSFGVAARGITVPVRGPYGDLGLLSVTRDCNDAEWDSLMRKVVGDLQVAAVHMHDNVMQSNTLLKALRRPQLSRREVEILQWAGEGKSQQDIGDILSISHRTVEVHLRSAREKMGALTTAQAVGRAIGLGLIHPG